MKEKDIKFYVAFIFSWFMVWIGYYFIYQEQFSLKGFIRITGMILVLLGIIELVYMTFRETKEGVYGTRNRKKA